MKNVFVLFLVAVFSLVIAGCEEKSEAEKAGEALDNALQDAADKLKE